MTTRVMAIAIFGLAFLPSLSTADQAEYISQAQAERAADLIKGASEIRKYCAPCGDTDWTPIMVENVSADPAEGEGFYSLYINWMPVDLAYTYFPEKGKWANLAMRVGLDVSEVPEFLPDSVGGLPPESARVHLKGTIGDNLGIVLSVWKSYTNINGTYAYLRYGKPIDVMGVVDSQGAFIMMELTDGKKSGLFNGRFTEVLRQAKGTWSNADDSKSMPFTLTEFAQHKNVDSYDEDEAYPKSVHMDFPVFVGPNPKTAEALNAAVQADLKQEVATFEAQWAEMKLEMKNNPPEEAAPADDTPTDETPEDMEGEEYLEGDYPPSASYSVGDYRFDHAGDSLISLLFTTYSYTGGAHGMSSYLPITLRIKDGAVTELELADLFLDGSDYAKSLAAFCLNALKEKGAGFVTDGTVTSFTVEELSLFTVSPRGITIYFPPYAAASYAEGSFDVTVPYEAVKDFVDPAVLGEVLKKP